MGPLPCFFHSERKACITSTRAARAAGTMEATTEAANRTNADRTTGKIRRQLGCFRGKRNHRKNITEDHNKKCKSEGARIIALGLLHFGGIY